MDLRASRQMKATIFYHKRSLASAIKALTDLYPHITSRIHPQVQERFRIESGVRGPSFSHSLFSSHFTLTPSLVLGGVSADGAKVIALIVEQSSSSAGACCPYPLCRLTGLGRLLQGRLGKRGAGVQCRPSFSWKTRTECVPWKCVKGEGRKT